LVSPKSPPVRSLAIVLLAGPAKCAFAFDLLCENLTGFVSLVGDPAEGAATTLCQSTFYALPQIFGAFRFVTWVPRIAPMRLNVR